MYLMLSASIRYTSIQYHFLPLKINVYLERVIWIDLVRVFFHSQPTAISTQAEATEGQTEALLLYVGNHLHNEKVVCVGDHLSSECKNCLSWEQILHLLFWRKIKLVKRAACKIGSSQMLSLQDILLWMWVVETFLTTDLFDSEFTDDYEYSIFLQ